MYAVFTTGGKQYRAAPGDTIKVEKLDVAEGGEIELNEVLMVADGDKVTVGNPLVDGTAVKVKVLGHGRGDKIRIIKFRRRKHHKKQMGHRQWFTELEVLSIGGASKASAKAQADKADKPAKADDAGDEKAAAKKATAKKASAKKAAAKKAPAKKAAAKKAGAKKASSKKAAAKKAAARKGDDE